VKVKDEKDGTLSLSQVISRGGHSTYRILSKVGHLDPRDQAFLKKLNELYCDVEVATKNLIAIDVLPQADIHKVYDVLEEAERSGLIEFQEGHCGHQVAPNAN